jgi:hypothetical protein
VTVERLSAAADWIVAHSPTSGNGADAA